MDRTDFAAEVADIRKELAELQTGIERVLGQARHLPEGDHLYHRIEAYPGLRFDRDMGAGVGPRRLAPGDRRLPRAEARHRVDPPAAGPGALGASPGPYFVRSRG